MAVVAEGARTRIYLSPTPEMEDIARQAAASWKPDVEFCQQALGFRVGNYGMTKWSDLFTSRQLVALTTYTDLVSEARDKIRQEGLAYGMPDDRRGFDSGGTGATAYADAVSVYLAFAVDRSADFWCNLCIWANQPKNELVGHMFSRQAISMAWDFGENNPFSDSGGNFTKNLDYVVHGIKLLPSQGSASVFQYDAARIGRPESSDFRTVSTDPPYYDNIGYADLSDFFYVWLRKSLRPSSSICSPRSLFRKPKNWLRHRLVTVDEKRRRSSFCKGCQRPCTGLRVVSHPAGPATIYLRFQAIGDGG